MKLPKKSFSEYCILISIPLVKLIQVNGKARLLSRIDLEKDLNVNKGMNIYLAKVQ